MAVRYLSDSWFRAVNEAARSSTALQQVTAGAHLTLQQVVTGGPEGDVSYWLLIDDGTVEAVPGEGPQGERVPDVTVTQSYETAAAVNRGELSTQDAFLDGRIRLRGDIPVLVRHQNVLNGIGEAFSEVRRQTEYR